MNRSSDERVESLTWRRLPRQFAIIEAPSSLGLTHRGVEGMPERLLRNGLGDRLNARHAARLEAPIPSLHRDDETRTLNAHALAEWSPQLADVVGAVLDRDEFPLVLGGDCSVLLGSALALRRRGRFGLVFIDGHADFYQPEANPNGEAASMELAFATGHGPPLLSNLEDRQPLIRADDVVAFGIRDEEEQRAYGSQPLPSEMLTLDLHTIRRMGLSLAVARAIEHVTRPDLDGYFIHFDADSLDDEIMPAVDYRLPGGFTWKEIATVLNAALSSNRAIGMELTIYNPTLDEDETIGRNLTDMLVATIGSADAEKRD